MGKRGFMFQNPEWIHISVSPIPKDIRYISRNRIKDSWLNCLALVLFIVTASAILITLVVSFFV